MKKGCLIAAGVGLALVAGIIFFAFTLTHGAVDAGNAFLSQIGSGKIHEAYERASTILQSQQTAGEFEENVKKLRLTDCLSASWSNRRMDNDLGQLEGSMIMRFGGKIPIHMELIKESGKWKVYSVSVPQAGVIVQNPTKSIPSDHKLKAMTLETLLAFNRAVKEKSFVAFQKQASSDFREEIGPEKLLESFKEFIDHETDISPIEKVQPIFEDPPVIDSKGILVLKGYYPTKPKQVVFGLKYVLESSGWKLQAINVNIPEQTGSHPLQATPSDEKLREMVLGSLLEFKKAIQQKSFVAFQKECSTQLLEKVSVEEMNEAFKSFMDNGVDLSAIEKVQPIFDATPQVDPDGVLALSGSCPGKPSVGFALKYVYEDGNWKIVEINVNGFLVKFACEEDPRKIIGIHSSLL
jgi:hypothetical protein